MIDPNQIPAESADSDKENRPEPQPNVADTVDVIKKDEAVSPIATTAPTETEAAQTIADAQPTNPAADASPEPEVEKKGHRKGKSAATKHHAKADSANEPRKKKNPVDGQRDRGKRGKQKRGQEKGHAKHAGSEKFEKDDSRSFRLSADGLLRHFLACQNCCYFLSGVQVLYGREVVDRLVNEFDGQWLYVPLNKETLNLLSKNFGVKIDQGDYHIDHACELCCRRFLVDLGEPEFEPVEENEDKNLSEPERREPVVFEPGRTREDREPDWEKDKPMIRVEFKNKR